MVNKNKNKNKTVEDLEDMANNPPSSKDIHIREKSEIEGVFDNLDNPDTINHNAILSDMEIKNCMVFDELKNLRLLPKEATITDQLKNLSVSKKGIGRMGKVEVASASRSAELAGRSGGGFFNKIGSLFKGGE